MKWSPNQEQAITEVGSNILVSAGAGSGKTAVLTERIYRLVKQGTPISRFLVLTFTKAASAEMKQRIRKKLLEDPECAHLAGDIENAHIETFDAFSLFLVKKYAYVLGIPGDVTNVDKSLINIKLQKIISDVFNEYYEKEDPALIKLVSRYCVKNDDELRKFLLNICEFANKQINKYEFLDNFIDTYFNETFLSNIVEEKYKQDIDTIKMIIENVYQLENTTDVDNLLAVLDPLLQTKNYDELYEKLKTVEVPRKPSGGSDGALRSAIKDSIDKLLPKNGDFGTKQEIINSYLENKDLVTLLITLAKKCIEQLDQFKKERNAYAFEDIASMAVRLIENKEISEDMKSYFDYILVDEYQDTSDIQERVISAIGKDNIYMVGDVKQSIYRFRNANCSIFQDKFINYKKEIGGKEIDLNKSFRSREEVVNAINELFLILMDPKVNPIDYKMGHDFEFGRKEYSTCIDNKNPDYKLSIPTYYYEKEKEATQTEIEFIASDIIDKINNHYKVFEPVNGQPALRDVTFKDFAIIIDRKTSFDLYKKVFTAHSIPLKNSASEGVIGSTVALTIKNLITLYNCIAKGDYESETFVHSFVGLHRSFLIKEKDQKIYDYVSLNAYRISPVVEKLTCIAEENVNTSVYSIVYKLIDEFDVYHLMPTIGNVVSNIQKIETLLDLSKNMDVLGYKLDDFVQYFKDLDEFKQDMDFSDTSVSENAVEIMTIHHSKGLEYPICYFPGLTKQFSREEIKSAYIINKKYGIILPISGETNLVSLFASQVKRDFVIDDYEEKIRVLYVALTRAKERIIIPLGLKEKESTKLDHRFVNTFKEMLLCSGIVNKYGSEMKIKTNALVEVPTEVEALKFYVKSINVQAKEIEKKRASKERSEEVNDELLEFGNEIHYLLEVVDYERKDTSFIKNLRYRKYIDNVLSLNLFKDVKNSEIRHEFSFFDQTNGVNGVIDCLIIKDDHIDIIDFKLKNIDDEKYVLQLHKYRDYIYSITNKKVHTYLISVVDKEVKEVE